LTRVKVEFLSQETCGSVSKRFESSQRKDSMPGKIPSYRKELGLI